jgi:protein O-mannosyl-transferase
LRTGRTALLCLILACVTLGVFWQVGSHQFINYDDPLYVTNNTHVKGGLTARNIFWAFTTTEASNWHPLTWLSHMADVEIFGLASRGHHLGNVFIHAASTLLLFFLLAQTTGTPWQSFMVAAFFALHPLHVESVAWVAERKDVLSGFLWTLTLFLYARYTKRPSRTRYLLSILAFVAGLMAKPMLVTLPVVMLLLDYWPLKRLAKDKPPGSNPILSTFRAPLNLLKEKVPFFILSLLSGIVTLYAQKSGGTMSSLDVVPLASRIGNALIAYAKYISNTVCPRNLGFFYPFPLSIPLWQVLISSALLAFISLGVIRLRRRFSYLIVGWLWFLLTLLPVIGLVQVGGQSMADRYTYIPLIGLFIIISWGVPDLLKGVRYRFAILVTLSCVAITALALTTCRQLGYWKDNILLYRHTLDVTRNNYIILNNLGIALAERGEVDAAIQAYERALRIWPKSVKTQVNLGAALADKGKFEEAIIHYREALRLNPDYALARTNWSKALNSMAVGMAQQGRMDEAIAHFNEALRIDPYSVDGHFNLGITLARLNRVEEAAEQFAHVLRLTPDSAEARNWLRRLGRPSKPSRGERAAK